MNHEQYRPFAPRLHPISRRQMQAGRAALCYLARVEISLWIC
jgi:hypothetical protein